MIALFSHPTQTSKIPVLDGVRAFACLSVLSYHIYYFLSHAYPLSALVGHFTYSLAMAGWSGVTLFFVLSGFLLFMPYAKSLLFAQQLPSWRTFYLRRALRILPGYYVALCLLIVLFNHEYLAPAHLKDLGLFASFLMDSTPQTYQKIDGPFWTLAIEWQYYMLLPLIALAFSWIVCRGHTVSQRLWLTIVCLIGMMVWGVCTRAFGLYYMAHPAATFLVSRPALNVFLWFTYGISGKYYEDFAVGMLVCTLYIASRNASVDNGITEFLRCRYSWFWGIGVAVLFFMAAWSAIPGLDFLRPIIGAHAQATELGFALGFALCILAVLFGSFNYKHFLSWRPICWFGDISYSLYIWHIPLLVLFMNVVIKKIPDLNFYEALALYWLYAWGIIVPLVFLFYRIVEVPSMNLAQRIRQKERFRLHHLEAQKDQRNIA